MSSAAAAAAAEAAAGDGEAEQAGAGEEAAKRQELAWTEEELKRAKEAVAKALAEAEVKLEKAKQELERAEEKVAAKKKEGDARAISNAEKDEDTARGARDVLQTRVNELTLEQTQLDRTKAKGKDADDTPLVVNAPDVESLLTKVVDELKIAKPELAANEAESCPTTCGSST